MRPATPRALPARHADAMILFTVGESAFAIPATAVDEIRNAQGLRPIAGSSIGYRKVSHTFLRGGRTYCVVDGNIHFGILPSKATRLLVLRQSNVSMLVSRIDRMAEVSGIHALPEAFTGEERNWYLGLAVLGSGTSEEVVPVVNAEAFLSRAEAEAVLSAETGKRE